MVNIANGNWIADLGAMSCRNIEEMEAKRGYL
jgi:hypothetical protein